MQGRVQAGVALKMLSQALASMGGATTPEAQAIAKAYAELSKTFGQAEGGLDKAELKLMGETGNPVPMPGPKQQSAFGDMARQQLGRLGMLGGGAPA